MKNRKRVIEDLELKLLEKDAELTKLNQKLDEYKFELDSITALKDTIPENCKPGTYCKGCQFAKQYYFMDYYAGRMHVEIKYMCGKGQICPNFLQKDCKKE